MRHGFVLARFVIIMAAIAATSSVAGCSSEPDVDVTGTWLGSLNVPDHGPLRLVFNLTPDTGGASRSGSAFKGTLDSPDQGALANPLTSVTVDRRHVAIWAAALSLSFDGSVQSNSDTIQGTFTQGSLSLPLTLTRQPGPLNYRRPQDPIQDPSVPLPYHSREVTFPSSAAGVTLAGTLTWPEGPGPFKAVVLVAGSGPLNRNEELSNHRPFLVLADALARAGVASLRYDKRGVGASTGDYAAATSADFATDARAGVAFLRTQTDFAVSSTGIAGHSEGGLVGPLAADANDAVAFLVLLAAPAITGEEVLVGQHRAIAAASGASPAELDAAEKLDRKLYACFWETSDPVMLEQKLRAVLTEAGLARLDQGPTLAALNTAWMRAFVVYDPIPVLQRTKVPVLALNGSLDLQVLAAQNLPPLRAALGPDGATRATVREVAGVNHLFQHAETGSPEEYGAITETMAPEVLSEVSAWIAGQ
jgi:uncharacterized protein